MQVKVGSYIGDGTDNRPITLVGIQPDLVIAKISGATYACWRSSAMVGDSTAFFANNANAANWIQSLDPDGFTVGTSLNLNGQTVHWIAIYDDGAGDFAVGTYTGNGIDNHDILGLGFQPDFIATKINSSLYQAMWSSSAMPANTTLGFNNQTAFANGIKSFLADGFRLGVNAYTNKSGSSFYWFAFKASPSLCQVGTYTGDGIDSRSITGIGFLPNWVMDKGEGVQVGCFRPSTLAGDTTLLFRATANISDAIQALEADGFQVGTSANVNSAGVDYYYLSLMVGGPQDLFSSDSITISESHDVDAPNKFSTDSVTVGDAVTGFGEVPAPDFLPALCVSDDPTMADYHQLQPACAVDSTGRCHVVWAGRTSVYDRSQIWYRCREADGTWGTIRHVSTTYSTENHYDPVIEIDKNGEVHIIWCQCPTHYYDTGSHGTIQFYGPMSPPDFMREDPGVLTPFYTRLLYRTSKGSWPAPTVLEVMSSADHSYVAGMTTYYFIMPYRNPTVVTTIDGEGLDLIFQWRPGTYHTYGDPTGQYPYDWSGWYAYHLYEKTMTAAGVWSAYAVVSHDTTPPLWSLYPNPGGTSNDSLNNWFPNLSRDVSGNYYLYWSIDHNYRNLVVRVKRFGIWGNVTMVRRGEITEHYCDDPKAGWDQENVTSGPPMLVWHENLEPDLFGTYPYFLFMTGFGTLDFTLTPADYTGPPQITRAGERDVINTVQITYRNRTKDYAQTQIEAMDDRGVELRGKQMLTWDLPGYTSGTPAEWLAHHALSMRCSPATSAVVKLGPKHADIAPGDLVHLNDPLVGEQWFGRVTSVNQTKAEEIQVALLQEFLGTSDLPFTPPNDPQLDPLPDPDDTTIILVELT